jgi:hypothetical protein
MFFGRVTDARPAFPSGRRCTLTGTLRYPPPGTTADALGRRPGSARRANGDPGACRPLPDGRGSDGAPHRRGT